MVEIFIDNAQRKRIVTFWIPVCLAFLHLWATLLVISGAFFNDTETVRSMFSACTWGISGLILLLISDKALEFIISRIGGVQIMPQTIEETTTKKTIVTPTESTKDVNIQTSGDVNVASQQS